VEVSAAVVALQVRGLGTVDIAGAKVAVVFDTWGGHTAEAPRPVGTLVVIQPPPVAFEIGRGGGTKVPGARVDPGAVVAEVSAAAVAFQVRGYGTVKVAGSVVAVVVFAATPVAFRPWGGGKVEVVGPGEGPRRVVVAISSVMLEAVEPCVGRTTVVVVTGPVSFEL